MCGIAGIVGKGSKDQIGRMLNAQYHRGPDAKGIYTDDICVLGHNRLSIIDLKDRANQPMCDNYGEYIIVFNGEIYNYLEIRKELENTYNFKTSSDTEVLLAAYISWGEDCLDKFIGMFAFAIWNKKEQILFAARDRFGVKPFYFAESNSSFYFASEVKAFWAVGIEKCPDQTVWANYLGSGKYGEPHQSFWKGINQLAGGEYLLFKKDKRLIIKKWYKFLDRIKQIHEKQDHITQNISANYEQLLIDSIRLRFRADVPIGFNLSGGLDSSTLLALVNKVNKAPKGLKAFTFTTGHNDYDEITWVNIMLKKWPHKLIENRLKFEEVPKLAELITYYQDEPFGGIPTLAYSKIFENASNLGIKVLLDGQGMDEAWAGYDYYVSGSGHLTQGIVQSPLRPNCLEKSFLELISDSRPIDLFEDPVMNLQYRDLFYTKIPRAVRFNDRISMMYSTELREPFLDHRLVEFAFAQPLHYKIRNNQQKWLLRKIATKYLGEELSLSPKRPLQTPQREWLSGPLKEWAQECIEVMLASEYGTWFNKKELNKEMNLFFQKGMTQSSFHIWQWISLGLIAQNGRK